MPILPHATEPHPTDTVLGAMPGKGVGVIGGLPVRQPGSANLPARRSWQPPNPLYGTSKAAQAISRSIDTALRMASPPFTANVRNPFRE